MQPAGTKELCDAIFQSSAPQFTPDDFETHLTLLNEYLTRVAAPEPLPAGCQVLLFDMAGFKFSYLMGDSFKLFQVMPRCLLTEIALHGGECKGCNVGLPAPYYIVLC